MPKKTLPLDGVAAALSSWRVIQNAPEMVDGVMTGNTVALVVLNFQTDDGRKVSKALQAPLAASLIHHEWGGVEGFPERQFLLEGISEVKGGLRCKSFRCLNPVEGTPNLESFLS